MYMRNEDSHNKKTNSLPQEDKVGDEIRSLIDKSMEVWEDVKEHYDNEVQKSEGIGKFSAWVTHASKLMDVVNIQFDLIRVLVTELRKYRRV